MPKILLIEDDPLIGRGLDLALKNNTYEVTWEATYKGGLAKANHDTFDLIILDVNLPDGDGFELCRRLRDQGLQTPIVILTAKVDEDSVVAGFDVGANDYVRKPFSQKELLVRIRALLKEAVLSEEKLRAGPILVLLSQRKVMIDNHEVNFNRREFDIFVFLVKQMGGVVRREEVISRLNAGSEIFDRTIDSHMSHIRAKLKRKGITRVNVDSVYGVGYRLRVE